jgi:hypothetical protein
MAASRPVDRRHAAFRDGHSESVLRRRGTPHICCRPEPTGDHSADDVERPWKADSDASTAAEPDLDRPDVVLLSVDRRIASVRVGQGEPAGTARCQVRRPGPGQCAHGRTDRHREIRPLPVRPEPDHLGGYAGQCARVRTVVGQPDVLEPGPGGGTAATSTPAQLVGGASLICRGRRRGPRRRRRQRRRQRRRRTALSLSAPRAATGEHHAAEHRCRHDGHPTNSFAHHGDHPMVMMLMRSSDQVVAVPTK